MAKMEVTVDGSSVDVDHPKPDSDAVKYVKETLEKDGAMVHSSQWTGWVPGGCHGGGDLKKSAFSIANLRIYGAVVQGSTPRKC